MLKYWFNVFYDAGLGRLPGKGVFLSVANEDELACRRNKEDMLHSHAGLIHLGVISTDIKEEWKR